MASIKKRGNTFFITVSLGFDSQGKRIRKTVTFEPLATTPAASRKEAEQFASEYEKRLKKGAVIVNSNITFNDFIPQWADFKSTMNKMTVSQIEQYQSHIKVHVSPVIGHIKIKDVTKAHCDIIIRNMLREGKSPATVRRIVTALSSVLQYAKYLGLIFDNPADDLELPKIESKNDIQAFTPAQAMTFLSALDGKYPIQYKKRKRNNIEVSGYTSYRTISLQWKVYFYLAVFGGFRRGEMCGLTWNDVNYISRSITVSKAVASTHAGQVTKDPKSDAGFRTVILPAVCFELLAQWEEEQKTLTSLSDWEGKPLRKMKENNIFIQVNGKPMDVHTPTHKFKEILDMYNDSIKESALSATSEEEREGILEDLLPEITLHGLRHTCASLLISAGTDPKTVSKRIGHSRTSITLDIYSHAYKENDSVASDTLQKLLIDNKKESPAPTVYN